MRRAIRASLKAQGFRIQDGGVSFRQRRDKRSVRKRHALAVTHKVLAAKPSLAAHEAELIKHVASSSEVDPQRIRPRLEQVEAGTWQSRLFRYACLHWSIPVFGRLWKTPAFLDFRTTLTTG